MRIKGVSDMIRKILLSFVIISSIFFIASCKDEVIDEQQVLPNLIGLNKEQASALLNGLDITYTFVDVIHNDVRAGRFISYEDGFSAGMNVINDMHVTIYFSKYANALPDLSGLNIDEMNIELDKFDFNVTYQEVTTQAFEEGIFISYSGDYQTGDVLPLGTDITILIAKAPDTRIQLPNLNFLYTNEIILILEELSIDYNIIEVENNNYPEGEFISYGDNLLSGDMIEPTTGVHVYVAINANRLPDLTGKNQSEILHEISKIDVILEIRTIETNDISEGLFVNYLNREAGQIVNENAVIVVYIATPIVVVNRNLMISTYVEGTLYNKAIEFYNLSNEPIDLSEFTLAQYIDGSTSISVEIALEGILQAHDTYVIAHQDASQDIKNKADLLTAELYFNGNDTIELIYQTGHVIDQIAWVVQYLDNRTLSRKTSITEPSSIFNYQDWDIYSNDNISPLGSHPTSFPTSFTYDPQYLSIPFPENAGMIKVTFISNNDGDTAQFNPGFTSEDRVRFVGIDTNETGSGTLATLARQFVYERLSQASEIYLQQDPSSGIRESYGRYLALVWADGVLLNYEIIKNGYAANAYYDSARTFSLNGVDLNTWMQLAETYAKINRLGMWA
jgi:beta-lactam-binding protein with PASTA domain/endonuclease YncB( thermonuclease family)